MKESVRETLRNVSDTLRAAVGIESHRSTAAVIVAAGSGTRMGSDIPKQFLPLCGEPVVVHAIRAFCASAYIDRIVCVIRPGDEEVYEEYSRKYGFDKPFCTVPGGSTRQESVLRGVEALDVSQTDYIAIHDGARPLITPGQIDTVCLAAFRTGAATAASRAVDTVKIAKKGDFIESTPDRQTVWNVSTPQVFSLNIYRAAAYSAKEEGFEATDDNALVEHIGRDVRLLDIGKFNLKITERKDLILAEALIKSGFLTSGEADES